MIFVKQNLKFMQSKILTFLHTNGYLGKPVSLKNKFKNKKIVVLIILFLAALFSSCGVSSALILNHNQNNTQVQLASNNFKVLDKVIGTADVTYIFMIGGLNTRQLYENAYSAMMDKANLTGSSKALVNIVTEEHIGGVPPFYYKRTITVSAHVIEFIK